MVNVTSFTCRTGALAGALVSAPEDVATTVLAVGLGAGLAVLTVEGVDGVDVAVSCDAGDDAVAGVDAGADAGLTSGVLSPSRTT